MSDVGSLGSYPDLEFTDLTFPDLVDRLEKLVSSVRAKPDMDSILGSVNQLMKDDSLNLDQIKYLKRIRQKAYDKKRFFKSDSDDQINFQTLPDPILVSKSESMSVNKIQTNKASVKSVQITRSGFWAGVWKGLTDLDGEKFIKKLPLFLFLALINSGVTYLVWLQSLELYKSNGFSSPQLAALGALAMMVGFSAFHAISKNWISSILCLYICSYEIYFMVAGTIQDESHKVVAEHLQSEQMIFLKENVERTRQQYQESKIRYEDPKSKVYKNSWFKSKFLNPTWEESKIAVKNLDEYQHAFNYQSHFIFFNFLKIFYRIGLVFLTMIFSTTLIKLFAPN